MSFESDKVRLDIACQGHVAFHFVYTASYDLDLFSLLEKNEGLRFEEIGKYLNINEYPLTILLKGLLTLRLLKKIDDQYVVTEVSSKYLVKSSPHNVIPILGWQKEIVYSGIVDFTESLKQEKNVGLRNFEGSELNLYGRLKHDQKKERIFHDAMSYISKQANAELPNLHDFSKYKRVVDVGGGDGSNCIALAKKYPDLLLTVFDQSSICKLAQKNIEKNGLSDRINTLEGDIFNTKLPENVDAVFFGHFFTIWSPDENIEILNKCYQQLPVGGSTIIYNMISDNDGLGPITPILGSAYFLAIATGKGQLYSENSYRDWFNISKFKEFSIFKGLDFDHALMTATK